MKRIHRRKRHFQLLELMVAAFILLVCIAPTIRIFTSMFQAQQEIIRENQRDHLAHLVHAKITELLYKRQLHIPEGTKNPPIPLNDPELINELKKFSYACEADLVIVDHTTPKDQEHPNRYLAQLVIKLKDVSPKAQKMKKEFENQDPSETFYDYMIYIDAGYKDKSNKDKKKADDDSKDEDKKKNPDGKSTSNPSGVKKGPSDQIKSPSAEIMKENE